MTHVRAIVRGRPARWLLLVSTVFGLATMHTLGHAGMRMDRSVRHVASAAAGHSPVRVVAATGAAAGPVRDEDDRGGHGGMTDWSVCLAVLGVLAAVVLAARFLRDRRERARVHTVTARPRKVPRSPPRPAAGLTMATTALARI